jgi:DNA (cytosine-5)-methyltransferase 1
MSKSLKRQFSFVDLFCGGGFGARGAVAAGGTPLAAVDLWEIATATYRRNFPTAQVLTDRVENVRPGIAGKGVDLLLTSPECTNHTHARGARPRNDESRNTAMNSLEWASTLKPRWIVMENVPNMKGWQRYQELKSELMGLGYGVRETVLCASQFGVPQRRRRLFITAVRGDEAPMVRIPRRARRGACSILDPVGTWPESLLYSANRAERTLRYAEAAMEELGGRESFLVVYYGSDKGGGWQSLEDPLRTVTTLDRFGLVRHTSQGWTIRMLQPPELARAMGVPKKHVFPVGTRRDKVKLCGNGICSPVMKEILLQLTRKQALAA